MQVDLPWPDPRLFPNAKRRSHWSKYRPVAKKFREDAATLTCVGIALRDKRAIADTDGKIPISITFIPPDRRKRDSDGVEGAFKHQRDGIADALGVDDNRFRVTYRHIDEPEKPGRVEVRFG